MTILDFFGQRKWRIIRKNSPGYELCTVRIESSSFCTVSIIFEPGQLSKERLKLRFYDQLEDKNHCFKTMNNESERIIYCQEINGKDAATIFSNEYGELQLVADE